LVVQLRVAELDLFFEHALPLVKVDFAQVLYLVGFGGLGLRVWGSGIGFQVWGLGVRVWGLVFKAVCRAAGSPPFVSSPGVGVQGLFFVAVWFIFGFIFIWGWG
jgi:hypothetical protein